VRANETQDQTNEQRETTAAGEPAAVTREPYVTPVIEKFPPMGNVTFATNIQPTLAMTLAGP
jgi:hypothetical protein